MEDVLAQIMELMEGLSDEEKVAIVEKLNSSFIKGDPKPIEGASDKNLEAAQDKDEDKKLSQSSDAETLKLTQRISDLENNNKLASKEAQFTLLLSQGKVVPAQKESFLKDDCTGLLDNAADLNLSQSSSGVNPKTAEKIDTKEKAEDKVMQLAQEKMKEDKSLSYGDCVSLILSQNPDLSKLTYPGV